MKSFYHVTTGALVDVVHCQRELQARSCTDESCRIDGASGALYLSGDGASTGPLSLREGRAWRAFAFSQRPLLAPRVFSHELEDLLGDLPPERALERAIDHLRVHEEERLWLLISPRYDAVIALRDPLGLCPLYVLERGGEFALTNTYRALTPALRDQPFDEETIAELLAFALPLSATRSAYHGLSRVPAGHAWIRVGARARVQRWWSWTQVPLELPDWTSALNAYRQKFSHAVEARTEALPTLLELSGGMDSNGIAAVASMGRHRHLLRAVTYVDSNGATSLERPLAALSAERLKIPLTIGDVQGAPTLRPPAPYGFAGPNPLLQLLPDDGTPAIVLSGQGGDPLFAITPGDIDRIFREIPLRQMPKLVRLQQTLHGSLPPFFLRRRLAGGKIERDIDDRRVPWVPKERWESLSRDTREANLRTRQLPGRQAMCENPYWQTWFEITDPGFTGVPLRWRFPFFDLPLMRTLAALPAAPFLLDKKIAREAWAMRLPSEITTRPKTLAPTPRDGVAIDPLPPDELLQSDAMRPIHALVDVTAIQRFENNPSIWPAWSRFSARNTVQVLRWLVEDTQQRERQKP